MAIDGSVPMILTPEDLESFQVDALLGGCIVSTADVAVLEVAGPAAVECLQGLVTADVQQAPDGAFLYGAILTPKGMIITDLWMARIGSSVWITVPSAGKAPLLENFTKYLPPRLATVTDHSDDYLTLRTAGPRSADVADAAGLDLPTPGHTTVNITGGAEGYVARPGDGAPFSLQVQAPQAATQLLLAQLLDHGATQTDHTALEVSRILAGWPALGAEIGEKTLPQEVRFDEHAGISYTKGCYTGQETVARLHFRGHANRELVGVSWEGPAPDPSNSSVTQEDQAVGRVTGMVWLEPLSQWVGLATLHRKADRDQPLLAADAEAVIIPLPMHFGP